MDGGRRYSFQPPNVSGRSAHMAHFTSAVYTAYGEGALRLAEDEQKTIEAASFLSP